LEDRPKVGPTSEPEEVKNLTLFMWVETGRVRLADLKFDSDSDDVWHGNKLADHLWNSWEKELARRGFTRLQFQQLMHYTTDDVLLWAFERIHWSELVERIMSLVDGDLGKAILDGRPI
jgi:hypothetical protein